MYLYKNYNGDDGIADGKHSPKHSNRLGVAHKLGGVVMRAFTVLHDAFTEVISNEEIKKRGRERDVHSSALLVLIHY